MIGLMESSPPESFAVVDVSAWEAEESEEMGARDKLWVMARPELDTPSHLWKAARTPDKLPEYGADSCAERIATEIAHLMGVKSARVELAIRQGERGVIGERIGGELRHGNELLSDLHPGYEVAKKGPVTGYDLASIRTVLSEYQGWSVGLNAFDCFVGLLVFDALVGNTDRHHENWAVVQDSRELAPSFDHGASLGFNANSSQMADAGRYASKAKARPFGRGIGTLDLAREALDMVTTEVGNLWIGRVGDLNEADIPLIVEAVPTSWMSDVRRTFVTELIVANRRRLLT